MKKLSILICIICFSTIAKTQHIDVFPPNWYTQMQDSSLQIIVKAKGISSFKLTNFANEISVTNSIPSNHPDYLLLNLKIARNTKPGFKKLIFSKGSEKIKIDFEMK